MRKARFTENQIVTVIKSVEAGRTVKDICRGAGISDTHLLDLWTTSVLQVLNLVLGCCLHLSGIRKICAQMGNPHTIASDRKSTRLNSSHSAKSRMPSSA